MRMSKSLKVILHILFWAVPILLMIFTIGSRLPEAKIGEISPMLFVWVNFGLYGIVNVSIFYLVLYLIIPYTLNKKKYLLFIFYCFITIAVYALIKFLIASSFKGMYLRVGPGGAFIEQSFYRYISITILPSGVMIFLAVLFKLLNDWFVNDTIQTELKNEKMQAELQFLKSQINPHFLFNSLNNIYALAYKKSDEAPDAILKLSEIMRYMLIENDDNKVLLADELKYLNSYIDIHKLRYKEQLNIDFQITGQVSQQRIMPLLLISFIENIFKHGIVNQADSRVLIRLDVDDERMVFYAKNKISHRNKDEVSGVGLTNIFRRLELMYQGRYQLEYSTISDHFEITLSLKF